MRGKRSIPCPSRDRYRITPADAGKTGWVRYFITCTQDHPRGCGENPLGVMRASTSVGSPPRMRGKPTSKTAIIFCRRITPADAGKTVLLRKSNPQGQDHPRGCGENCRCLSRALSKAGSPPRMRGKPGADIAVWAVSGITPADAGKTISTVRGGRDAEDHPRGCGENQFAQFIYPPLLGSPPRMRGKPVVPADISTKSRITPADAGKT